MNNRIDLLICNSSKLLTLKGKNCPRIGNEMQELSDIKDGAIAIKNDLIIDIGRSCDLLKKYPKVVKTIDAKNNLVMPGFIDCHTHLVFGGSRENEFKMKISGDSYLDILSRGGGIHSTVNTTRNTNKLDLFNISKKKLNNMLLHGTTFIEVKSGYGLDYDNEKKILEIIKELKKTHSIDLVSTFLGAHVFPQNIDKKDYIKLICDKMLPDFINLAENCDIFIENGAFTLLEAKIILTVAKRLRYNIKLHAGQFNDLNAVEFAANIGAISVDHLEYVSYKQLNSIKKSGTIAVLLPGVPFYLMLNKYPNARYMISNNNAVALATDFNPGSCPTYSMQMIIALACYNMKMSPEEAIIASTINAACAINRCNIVGSIEIGKKADIIIMNIKEPAQIPYYFGTNLVEHVIKSGRIINFD